MNGHDDYDLSLVQPRTLQKPQHEPSDSATTFGLYQKAIVWLEFLHPAGIDVTANVMDVREICAEELRAMSDRSRYRDFYDMYFILKVIRPSFDKVVDLLQQKEIRQPILKDHILANWELAQQLKREDVVTIYLKEPVEDAKIWEMIQGFDFDPIYPS